LESRTLSKRDKNHRYDYLEAKITFSKKQNKIADNNFKGCT